MMALAKLTDDSLLRWWCPGCESNHVVPVMPGEPAGWFFDGNLDAPTVNPSVLVYAHDRTPPKKNQPRCHAFVRAGRIEFLADCEHPLSGTTVDMVDV
jgi:hypothetical protein